MSLFALIFGTPTPTSPGTPSATYQKAFFLKDYNPTSTRVSCQKNTTNAISNRNKKCKQKKCKQNHKKPKHDEHCNIECAKHVLVFQQQIKSEKSLNMTSTPTYECSKGGIARGIEHGVVVVLKAELIELQRESIRLNLLYFILRPCRCLLPDLGIAIV